MNHLWVAALSLGGAALIWLAVTAVVASFRRAAENDRANIAAAIERYLDFQIKWEEKQAEMDRWKENARERAEIWERERREREKWAAKMAAREAG